MKIIISPAKKMVREQEVLEAGNKPSFAEDARKIRDVLRAYSMEELQAIYRANLKITEENYYRLKEMDFEKDGTPALLSYSGIQFQSMAPRVFTGKEWDYVKKHLYILSGFYGILRADDQVLPYRLEMQARLSVDGKKDLYDYWNSRLYEKLTEEGDHVIINLASKEYSRAVEPYLKPEDRFITCVFGQEKDKKVVVKATAAKMARGAMVRFLAENTVLEPEALTRFSVSGYCFRKEYSSDTQYIFTQNTVEGRS